jgi:hypothetical protein
MDIRLSPNMDVAVQHRHGDQWFEMEERGPATAGDPERDWAHGRVYYCTPCDEEIRVQVRPTDKR